MARRRLPVKGEPTQLDAFGERKRLGDLIETATISPLLYLDDRVLSSIKSLVRSSDDNAHAAFDLLLERLRKNHSQVRYLAVLLTDELFTRSKLFRSLLVPVFETFMVLSVGFRATHPLPPPEDRAALLRKKSIEIVEKWKDSFGMHYKPVRLGYEYLKNTLRLEFPNAREVATLAGQQRRERELRTQELLKRKLQTLREQYPDLKAEIQSTIVEIGQCLEILVPPGSSGEAPIDADIDEDDEFEQYGVESLRLLRDKVEEEDKVPHESRDNSPVFDSLRDLYKLLITRHLVTLQEWLTTLMRVDPENDQQSRDALLRDTIDLRNQLLKARDKCEAVGIRRIEETIQPEVEEDLDDVFWEEGYVEMPKSIPVESTSAAEPSCNHAAVESNKNDGKSVKETVGIKHDLLKQAPVLPWGTFLDSWGSQSEVPANSRGLEFETHWGKVDYDVMIPRDKIAELSIRASYYKMPKAEIGPCLAPLRKGGLCQRRDLQRCPFHGRIIPRDEEGKPIPREAKHTKSAKEFKAKETASNESRTNAEVADVLSDSPGPDLGQIAEQAIDNLRKKDKESKALAHRQRAKRAREHNDTCLRNAALDERRLFFGDASSQVDAMADGRMKKPRGGLTALLRKTPTSKDRLARRLLNGRVRDATVCQLARDQEAAYRESFPNQWTMK